MQTTTETGSTRTSSDAQAAPTQLVAVIEALLRELRGGETVPVLLDDDLEESLGIDSLSRMELMLRLEQAFGVCMPEGAVQSARTPRDLLRAVAASPRRATPTPLAPVPTGQAQPKPARARSQPPRQAQTLLDVLTWHAGQGESGCHVRLLHPGGDSNVLTPEDLLQRAQRMAASLQALGLAPGDTVALMLPTGFGFFECFMGILFAGGVPVPIYPPFRPSQIEDHLRRQANILASANAAFLVSDGHAQSAARILHAGAPCLRGVLTTEELRALGGRWQSASVGAHDTALVQYTSGSTGQPKGVVLTHANLLANIRAMGQAVQAGADDTFVSWLPLYHDMGLIGAWLGSLYHGASLVLMPPQDFLARPSRWLRAISDHGGTLTAAPNFAYEILATRVHDDELQGIDLRSCRAAMNGSEPVHATTLERFCQRFAQHGFERHALMPVYGLAECGVGLAFPPLRRGPKIDVIDREALHQRMVAIPSSATDARAMQVVCCGLPLPGHELRVVDEREAEVPERHEGRIEFRGPSATAGYLRNPQASRALFRGEWLDTGDVGYVVEGEVYVTSRIKDLIKRGGHNVHPYDLEEAVGALPGVRRGCVAVFGAAAVDSRSERIVVLAETSVAGPDLRQALRDRIARLSVQVLGQPADEIVLAAPRSVLKTSSGKIRRADCRRLYEQGRLGHAARGVPRQLASLWVDAMTRRVRQHARLIGEAFFALWLWTVFATGAALAALAALMPSRPLRKRIARAIARAGLGACGLAIEVTGNPAPAHGPWVFASNHASYLDWLVLTAVLPAQACFVAKRELARWQVLRWVLVRMGVHFVERDDVHASVEDAKRLFDAVASGESLVYFPEGTLMRAPGLRPFHMGAFIAAAQSGASVVPVSLRGTRSVLRDGSWWPRKATVVVEVHEPLRAEGPDWPDAVTLRDRTRERIASACGEPVLS